MPIISVEIMKTIDERHLQKTTKEKPIKTERNKGNRSYSERVRAKWFCCAFKFCAVKKNLKDTYNVFKMISCHLMKKPWKKMCQSLIIIETSRVLL